MRNLNPRRSRRKRPVPAGPDLFAWAALAELCALPLPAAKLAARLGFSPSLARLYAGLAGLGPERDR